MNIVRDRQIAVVRNTPIASHRIGNLNGFAFDPCPAAFADENTLNAQRPTVLELPIMKDARLYDS